MADKTVTVAPSGGTYTTLQGAITGEVDANPNLVTMGGVLNIVIQGDWSSTSDSTAVTVDGFTTSTSCYVNIYTDSSNRAKASGWDTTRYQLIVTDDDAIDIRDNYVRADGLQVQHIYSAVAANSCIKCSAVAAANNYVRISNCRCVGDTNAAWNGYGIWIADADAIADIYNCIVENGDGRGIFLDNQTTVNVFNCVVYNWNVAGVEIDVGTTTFKNCAVLNTADDFKDDSAAATIDHCASDDNDGTNNVAESGGGVDWTGDFTDGSGGNWTLLASSGLVGTGVDDPGSGLYSTDIDGTARTSTWDVGADEYVAAGGASVVPQAMAYYQRLRQR